MQKLVVLLIVIIPVLLAGNLIEVDINGGGDHNTIQGAIESSVNGDTLLVYPGEYEELINYGGRDIVVISLYYTTEDSSYIEDTIINGNEEGCVVTFENMESPEAVLGGLTIRNGLGSMFPDYRAGGISCLNFSSPTLRDLKITSNNYGVSGGIYCEYSDPLIENCHIFDNIGYQANYGGGITLYDSNALITGCLIENNHVYTYGGGICVFSLSDPVIENTIIRGNRADAGGGIYAQACNLTLTNVILEDNYGSSYGGGIALHFQVNTDFENVICCGNDAGRGGGLYLRGIESEITGISIENNTAGCGGAIAIHNACVTLVDMELCGNIADLPSSGSIELSYFSHVTCEGITFVGNVCESESIKLYGSSSLFLHNCIMADEGTSIFFNDYYGNNNYLEVSYCNFTGGEESLECSTNGSYVWGEGNISVEPGFASPETGDWRLMYYSECIDAGDPESEYDPDGTIRDLGALYYDQDELVYPEINIPDYLNFESGEIVMMDFSQYIYDINPDDLTLSVSGNENVLVDIDEMEVTFSCLENWSGVEQLVFYVNDNSGRLVSSAEMTVDVTIDIIHVPEDHVNIQDAIQQACTDSTTIIVAPGEYHENLDFLGKNINLVSYYETTGDSAYISETIIDGDSLVAVIRIDSSSVARISGFTIRNGCDNNFRYIGAGINADHCSSITIENSIIENNNGYFGGILVNNSSIDMCDTIIRNNSGKALIINNCFNVRIDNIDIYNNNELSGSCINCDGSGEVIIEHIYYHDNYSDYWSSGLSIESIDNGIITGINYEENIFDQGYGGLSLISISNSIISNVTLRNNSAVRHPALKLDSINSTILSNIVIENNEADEFSSGIVTLVCGTIDPIIIVNTLINNNISSDMSSAIYSENSNIFFINSSIINNSSENGAAVVSTTNSNELYFQNCIIHGNEPAQVQINMPARTNTIYIDHCNLQDGEEGVIQYGNSNLYWEEGNIDADPQFTGIDPYPFALVEFSPCIDVGTLEFPVNFELPETDLAGNPRVSGSSIDIGCFEFQHPGCEKDNLIPEIDRTFCCYPNPFNPETTVSFSLAELSEVQIMIYNVKGQKVRTLADETFRPDDYSIVWKGKDDKGRQVGSGMYFVRLKINNELFTNKVVLLK